MDNNNILKSQDEQLFPHSPDVLERETSDEGFSKGWGMHFMPEEKYWADVHTHLEVNDINRYKEALENYKIIASGLNVGHAVVILPFLNISKEGSGLAEIMECACRAVNETEGLAPMLYIDYKKPDPELIDKAVKMVVKGIKLHNAPIITEGGSSKVWLADRWRRVFDKIGEHNLPVLWHVTQRLTDSPYTGGGRNTYWKEGWEKGIKYTNQDLLDVFLEIVGSYPDICFIGAHQLHIGWERIASLFDKYANLYIDTSVGCFVREFDRIYPQDRDYLRQYFIKYCDRILFGTDTIITGVNTEHSIEINYKNHMRFIRQLQLPYEELQKIAYGNLNRVFGIN